MITINIMHGNAITPYRVVFECTFDNYVHAQRFARRVCRMLGEFYYWVVKL